MKYFIVNKGKIFPVNYNGTKKSLLLKITEMTKTNVGICEKYRKTYMKLQSDIGIPSQYCDNSKEDVAAQYAELHKRMKILRVKSPVHTFTLANHKFNSYEFWKTTPEIYNVDEFFKKYSTYSMELQRKNK